MLMKATRLRPGVPLQAYVAVIVDEVISEVVGNGTVVVETEEVC